MSTAKNMFGGIPASELKKNTRIKALAYGPPGCGKSYWAYQFPEAQVIDTEFASHINRNLLMAKNSVIHQTNNLSEIYQLIQNLSQNKHGFKTVIIDSLSILYNRLVEEETVKNNNPSNVAKPYLEARRKLMPLISLLYKLDMNVIVTCHIKDNFKKDTDALKAAKVAGKRESMLEKVGDTFDFVDKIAYVFHIIMRISYLNKTRKAIIEKFRDASDSPKNWQDYDFVLTYDNFLDICTKMELIDKDSFLAESTPIVAPAGNASATQSSKVVNIVPISPSVVTEMSDENWVKLGDLIGHLNVSQEKINVWLEDSSRRYGKKFTQLQNIPEEYALKIIKKLCDECDSK